MHELSRRTTLLVSILAGCEPKAETDDEVGDTTSTESDTDGSGSESDTSSESETESISDTESSETDTDTDESETTQTETETGDPDPFELIPANADWFDSTRVIAHRRLGDAEQLLLGGSTPVETFTTESGVLAIDLDGTTRWKSVEPWLDRMHLVHALEPLADGGTWLTGGTYDLGTLVDGPGWIWLGALDFAGSWMWLEDTPHGNLPGSTALRADGTAAILHWVLFGYGMHSFSATGELEWSLGDWGTIDQLPQQLVAVPDGVIAGGYEAIGGVGESSEDIPWFRRISNSGEPLDAVVYPGPAGAFDNVAAMRFDDAALTVEVLIQRSWDGSPAYEALWLTLAVDDLSLLATRELAMGSPSSLELDGSGGIWISTDDGAESLHHFDAAGNQTWTTPIGDSYDIAFDHQEGLAYVLRSNAAGIDVVPLR